jgi:putative NIF3 family GTP cyclohydrolase 1 type 2
MMTEKLRASEAIARVVAAIGVPRRVGTVDEVLAGDADTAVTGVVTTMMASFDVLRRAVSVGANLVITHEPVFWDHRNEAVSALIDDEDPVYSAKLEYITEHGLVVWHLHDQLHDLRPDLIDLGTCHRMGWDIPSDAGYPAIVDIPTQTVADLTTALADRLNAASARHIGRPDMNVSRVGLALGFRGVDTIRRLLERRDVDAVVAGEIHEWEAGAYAADMVSAGLPKALIVVGHIPSEQSGMIEVTGIVERVLPAAPVHFIPCQDLYRR